MINIRLKSILLGLSVIAGLPSIATNAEDILYPTNILVQFAKDHRVAVSIFGITWAIFNARLETRKKANFKLEDLREDYEELLRSFNIFDTKLYKQLLYMFDKYIIGLPVKLTDKTDREKIGNKIITIKSTHLEQKPFGLYGLTHAYVLKPLKNLVEYLVPVAAVYVLIVNPIESFKKAAAGK